MDLLNLASKPFADNLGSDGAGLDANAVSAALGGLLRGDGDLDIGALVSKFSSGGKLLESVGGAEGILGMASKLFK